MSGIILYLIFNVLFVSRNQNVKRSYILEENIHLEYITSVGWNLDWAKIGRYVWISLVEINNNSKFNYCMAFSGDYLKVKMAE